MPIVAMPCPVCLDAHGTTARVEATPPGLKVDCKICGSFGIEDEAYEDYLDPKEGGKRLPTIKRSLLSHRLREFRSDRASDFPRLTPAQVRSIVESDASLPTPAAQLVNAIREIGDFVSATGTEYERASEGFCAIIGAANPSFATSIVSEMIEKGLAKGTKFSSNREFAAAVWGSLNLTLDGWALYEASRRGSSHSKVGFVALKFGEPELDALLADFAKPAIKAIGYELHDMRTLARAGVIDNVMRAQIRDATFMLADLTHDNAGAYWEAGYAEGLGKPVIYLCEAGKFEAAKTHFDTNHCTTVLWKIGEEGAFCDQLVATLRRTLGLFE